MATPRKAAAKKAAAKKAPVKKTPAKKAPAKKAPAKKAAAKKQQPSVRSAATKARGAAEDISFVAKSKVKDLLKQLDMRTDSQLVDEVNRRVREMLEGAANRAKGNKRSTVRPHDL